MRDSCLLKPMGRLLPAALLLAGLAGCQARNGALFHPYGVTRVPPPPTHSYTIPKSYYGTPGNSNANNAPARQEAVGSGVTAARELGGVIVEGMPVNDATRLVATPGAPSGAAKPPVTTIPRAPGLQFIRRMSWTTPVSNSGTSPPAAESRRAPSASDHRSTPQRNESRSLLKEPSVARATVIGSGVRAPSWRPR